MKKCISVIVVLIPTLIICCAPPQSGQRVWNIATKNIFITQTIESKLDGLSISSIDTIAAFSNLDQILDKVTTVESKAVLLLQEIDSLQSNLIEDLSQSEQIQSDIGLMESSLMPLDLSSVFTALDALQITIVSAMDLLNTDLEIIVSNIDVLAASEMQYFQTVASQLDKLDDDVAMVSSLLDGLSAQFSLTTFDSITDLLHQDLVTLESNVDVLADQLAGGFAGTFSILDQNMLLAQTIESLVDTIDVMDGSDLTGTYSLLDQLEISVQTMDSLTDLLVDTFATIQSTIDILGSALDESVSKYMFVESRTSLLVQKIEELVNNPSFSTIDQVTSLLDHDISLLEHAYAADLPALTNSIQSKLDHIIAQQNQQISDLDTIASNLDAIANIQNGTIISKLEIANSLLDDTIDDAFATESYLDFVTDIEQLFVITNNAQSLQEQISYIDLVVPQISSKMLLIDDLLATIDSTLDIIDTLAQSNLDNAITLESIVDTLSFVAQPSDSIASTLDVISSQEDVVISKLAVASQLITTENTEAQGLIGDFQSTWTILRSIDTKLAQASSSLSLIDAAAIDTKFVSYSSVFTMIDTIVRNEATINSQVDAYNSMVNVLTSNINTDFNGVFTALNAVIADVSTSTGFASSMLSTISSKLSVVQTELGFPIYQRNIPLTITTPGRYYLAENINYSGASDAIAINTSNVTIDLNGRTLNYTGVSTTVRGIFVNNVSNTKIINGTVSNFIGSGLSGGGLATGAGATTNIVVYDTQFLDSGIKLNGSGGNHKFYNLFINGPITGGDLDTVSILAHTNVDLQDSAVFNHRSIDSRGNCSHVIVERCQVGPSISGGEGFAFNGVVTNWIVKECAVINTFRAYYTNTATRTGCDILDSFFIFNSGFGIGFGGTQSVIKNTSVISSTRGMLNVTATTNNFIGFNTFIQNTVGNINVAGANTYLGNFAFNTNASGSPAPTNYTVSGSNITGKFITISQRTGISGAIAPTYWHNINMLP